MDARMRAVSTAILGIFAALSLAAPSEAGAVRALRPVAVKHGHVVYSLSAVKHRRVVAAKVRAGRWSRRIPASRVRQAIRHGDRLRVKVPARVLAKAKAKARKKAKVKAKAKAKRKPATSPAPAVPIDIPLVVVVVAPPPPAEEPAPPAPATPTAPSTPAEPATPTAGQPAQGTGLPSGLTSWRPTGSEPLSDEAAAALVVASPELRPANATANHHAPTAGEIRAFHEARYLAGGNKGRLGSQVITTIDDVSGNFTGTTDEILQWVSYKWGIPLDAVRAVAQNESNWNMSYLGDKATVADATPYPEYSRVSSTSVYQSLGIMQVKWKAEGTLHVGTEPLRHTSTAFNVDYWAANMRFFFDGGARLWFGSSGSYQPGDEWLSVGAWYNPTPWKNADQLLYIDHVQQKVAAHAWTSSGF